MSLLNAARRGVWRAVAIVTVATVATLWAPAVAGARTVSPDGLWTWSRPLPHGYRATAIASPAAGACFVAAGLPDVLLTRDGGATWTWGRSDLSPLTGAIWGVRIVTSSVGWGWGSDSSEIASADEGVLLRTDDAGATWRTQFRAPGIEFIDFSCADSMTAWAAGRDAGHPDRLVLYATTDGGERWTEAVPPADEDVTYEALGALGPGRAILLQAVWSRGAGSGEVVGTRIWRTSDGGAHWTPPATLAGAHVVAVSFSSAERGWAAGAAGSIWTTEDGGAGWRRQYRPTADLGLAAVDSRGDDVWAVGSRGFLHSFDGGLMWQLADDVHGRLVSFSDTLGGWIVEGTVYRRTMDGGQTWSRVTSAPQTAVTSLQAVAGGVVWGAADHVILSPDGGEHWLRAGERRGLNAVAARNARQAWAVGGDGVIVGTRDGGETWATQASGTSVDLVDVCFVSGVRGWAVGGEGLIVRTGDGGRHWQRSPTGTRDDIVAVEFGDARHGLALLAPRRGRAMVLRTADGGRSWSRAQLPVPARLPTALTFTVGGPATLVARDAAGATWCWRTADGGLTWRRGGELPGREIWNAVAGSGARLCAAGSSGAVVLSDDGGDTWSFAGRPAGRVTLTTVQHTSGGGFMLAGESGAVLMTGPMRGD